MTRRSWAFDVAIALVVAVLGMLEALWGIDATHRQGPHWAQALLYVVTALLLVVRRIRPLGCLATIVGVSVVEFALFGSPEGQGVALPGIIAGYTVANREERRRAWWGLVLLGVLWLGWAGFDPVVDSLRSFATALIWFGPWVVAWLVGALVQATRQATEQRRLAREQRASRAVAEERNRIARELHDVIGHSVSVMTVQASAVRRRLTADQEVERQALETVEAVGREALAEMRRMVGVLREAGDGVRGQVGGEAAGGQAGGQAGRQAGNAANRQPPPGLDQVGRLVAEFRTAGLPVAERLTGDVRPLPPGLDLTAYRLIQEGLTNTLRHAVTPVHVEVGIEYGERHLQVTVRDDGRAGPAALDGVPGHGLLGMRERVSVYGGELVAGPCTGGGFELVATLPLDDVPLDEQAQVETA